MSKKVALISGITGQDGSFLAEFLIEKGSVSGRMGTGYEAEPTGEPALGGYDGQ